MKPKAVIKSLLWSWDLLVSLVIVLVASYFVPGGIPYTMAKEIFGISVSVLSIIFSVFFAALAVLITSGDDKFIRFLEEDGSYREIVWTFKVTLLSLFISLLASIVLFVTVLPYQQSTGLYPEWCVLVFSFFALYALFAAISSTLHAIKYAEYRARFLDIIRDVGDSTREN